jgi:mannose-1-phosphate guanylyltransferase
LKAIILAGGYATRLRPISYAIPKLLFPLVGKPILYWNLDRLKGFGVEEVVLGVNYLAQHLKEQVGRSYKNMRITFSLEDTPLGTAGPIRLAAQRTRFNQTFLAMNGDIISDVDLKEMLKFHESTGALVTDALHQVRNPTRFGVAELDGERRIQRFIEKPRVGQTRSRLVNAGIYLMEPEVIRMIPKGRKVSLEREIFPPLAKRRKLVGFPFENYWFDIGNLADYRKANFTLLSDATKEPLKSTRNMPPGIKLIGSVYVDDTAKVESNVCLGPSTLIGNNSAVKAYSRISKSILFDHVKIGEGCVVSDATIASNVTLGEKVVVESGSVLSPNVTVKDHVKIGKGSIIHPHREIARSVKPKTHVM